MVEDAIYLPPATDVMSDYRVEDVRAVAFGRRTLAHDLLDLVDAVAAAAAIETVAFDRFSLFCSFAPLAPNESPLKCFIDVGELTDRRIERIAGNGKRLVGSPEQLSCDLLAVDCQR